MVWVRELKNCFSHLITEVFMVMVANFTWLMQWCLFSINTGVCQYCLFDIDIFSLDNKSCLQHSYLFFFTCEDGKECVLHDVPKEQALKLCLIFLWKCLWVLFYHYSSQINNFWLWNQMILFSFNIFMHSSLPCIRP